MAPKALGALLLAAAFWQGGAADSSPEIFHDSSRDGELEMTTKERYEWWQGFYADPRAAGGKDWYGTWEQFKGDVQGGPFKPKDKILAVGCGVSDLPVDLVKDGLPHVTAVDYSAEGIRTQKQKYEDGFPTVKWLVSDMRAAKEFEDESYDVVIEKALLDGEGAWGETSMMIAEIHRVLKPGGRYISVSLGQPDELDSDKFFARPEYGWSVQSKLSYDDYWVYTMTKNKSSGKKAGGNEEL